MALAPFLFPSHFRSRRGGGGRKASKERKEGYFLSVFTFGLNWKWRKNNIRRRGSLRFESGCYINISKSAFCHPPLLLQQSGVLLKARVPHACWSRSIYLSSPAKSTEGLEVQSVVRGLPVLGFFFVRNAEAEHHPTENIPCKLGFPKERKSHPIATACRTRGLPAGLEGWSHMCSSCTTQITPNNLPLW